MAFSRTYAEGTSIWGYIYEIKDDATKEHLITAAKNLAAAEEGLLAALEYHIKQQNASTENPTE